MKHSVPPSPETNASSADLHFHTTLSDGGITSAWAVAECVKRGISFAVATEHDVVNREFPLLARFQGIESLEGVEISARAPIGGGAVKHLHLTAYSKRFAPELDLLLEWTRMGRVEKMKAQCEKLRSRGFEVTYAAFLDRFRESGCDLSNLTNFHLAEYLVEKSETPSLTQEIMGAEVTNPHDFIRLFLKRDSPFPIGSVEMDEYEPTSEASARIVVARSKGVLSIAHPNFTFEKEGAERFENEIARKIVESGVNGIELNPHAEKDWTSTVLRVRERFGLVLTFGSDCHFLSNKTDDGRHSLVGGSHPLIVGKETSFRIERLLAATA